MGEFVTLAGAATASYKNESVHFPGKPEEAFFAMVSHYDELKVGKQEVKYCPEEGCNYSSNNKSDLKDHINSRHIHYPCTKCEICFEKFFTRRNYNRHRKTRHKAELLSACVENGKIRKRGEEEEDDDEEEQQNINFRLMTPAINESTIFLGTPKEGYQSMLQHYKRLKVCKQDVIKCPERNCQYTCNNKTDLKGHINSRHIHYRVIECEVCGEWFYTQKAAHSHKKNRHPDFSFSQGNHRASRNHQAAEEEEDSEDDSDDSQTDDDLDISTGNYSKQSAAGLDPANGGVQASNGKQAKGSNTIKIESPKSSHRSHPTVQRRRSTRSQKNVTININTNSSDSNTPSPHSNPIQPSASSQPQIIQLSSLMQPHNVQIHAMQTQEQGIITSLPLHQTPHHIIHIRPTPDAAFVAHFRPVTGQSFPNYQHHPYLQSMQTPYGTFSAAACVYRPNIQLTNTQALNGGNSGGGGIINESIEYPADSLSFMDEGLDLDQELDFPQPSIYHTNPYNGLPTTVKINTNDVTLTSPTNAATSAPMTQVSMTTASVSASPLVSSSSVAASHNNSIQNQWIWSR